jgi:hypothetical protein
MESNQPVHSLFDAESNIYSFRQKGLPNNEYYEKFKDLVTNAERLGSIIGIHPDWVETILECIAVDSDNPTEMEKQQAHEKCKDPYLEVMFLMNSDKNRYGGLVCDIENEYT